MEPATPRCQVFRNSGPICEFFGPQEGFAKLRSLGPRGPGENCKLCRANSFLKNLVKIPRACHNCHISQAGRRKRPLLRGGPGISMDARVFGELFFEARDDQLKKVRKLF